MVDTLIFKIHRHVPQAAALFDKFHVMKRLGEVLDKVRKSEYARLEGKQRHFIKGQKYTLLSHPQNLTGTAHKNLKLLLAANRRLNTVYVLKESLVSSGATAVRRGSGSSLRVKVPTRQVKPSRRCSVAEISGCAKTCMHMRSKL